MLLPFSQQKPIPNPSSPTFGIQEAVDALPPEGGEVVLAPGRYLLKCSVRVRSKVTLRGAGAATLLVKCDGVATPLTQPCKPGDTTLHVADSAGFEVGMQIALARLNEGYAPEDMDAWGFDWVHPRIKAIKGKVLHLDKAMDDTFAAAKTTVVNFFPAFEIDRAEDVTLESVHIDGAIRRQPEPYSEFQAAAIAVLLSKNVRIRNCVVREWPSDGISIQGGRDVVVSGCAVERVRGHGFHPGSGVLNAHFLDNRGIGNRWDGLCFCQAVKHSVVQGNIFESNGRHGIGGLGGGKDPTKRDELNVVSKNQCLSNAMAGIEVAASQGHVISENICRNNSKAKAGQWPGVAIRDASRLVVSGNICVDDQESKTQSHGIQETGDCSDNVFQGNQSYGNLKRDVRVKAGP